MTGFINRTVDKIKLDKKNSGGCMKQTQGQWQTSYQYRSEIGYSQFK